MNKNSFPGNAGPARPLLSSGAIFDDEDALGGAYSDEEFGGIDLRALWSVLFATAI